MNRRIRWTVETAVMLALLVSLQTVTRPMGQLVTGSCVNAVLAVSALAGGLSCGLTVALFSPVLAFLLGIAPQILTVPAIMAGNCVFVVLLSLIADKNGKNVLRQVAACVVSAAVKAAVLYAIVVLLICGALSESLLASGVMKAPMLKALPVTFGWPQLATALAGSALGLVIVPVLRKALNRQSS